MPVKYKFQSGRGDKGGADAIQPSHFNAEPSARHLSASPSFETGVRSSKPTPLAGEVIEVIRAGLNVRTRNEFQRLTAEEHSQGFADGIDGSIRAQISKRYDAPRPGSIKRRP
jgi:hypothetical protein